MSDQHFGGESTPGAFGEYPFDPPPSGFEERRTSGLAWLPIVIACGVAMAIVMGGTLFLLRSGSSNDDVATGQSGTDPMAAEPDTAPQAASGDESDPKSPDAGSAESGSGSSVTTVAADTAALPAGADGSVSVPTSVTTAPATSTATSTTPATTSTTTSASAALSSTTVLATTSVVVTTEAPSESTTETSAASGGAGAGATYPNPAVGSGPAGSGCGPATGTLPDGLWFGRMQRAPDAPNDGFWGDDKIQLMVYCLYGGEAATELAAERLDEMRPGLDFYVIRDDTVRRTISRSVDAQARELLDITGAASSAVPWDQGLATLGSLTGEGCCTEGWAWIESGAVVEIAVIREGGFTYSFPRPRGAQCSDNGLDVNPLIMLVGSVPDENGLPLHTGPGFATEVSGTVPIGTILNVVHRCEIAADGYGWWMLDWDGRAVWGPGEFLVPRN